LLKDQQNFKEMIRVKDIFGLMANNWWRWEKKEMEVCPALS